MNTTNEKRVTIPEEITSEYLMKLADDIQDGTVFVNGARMIDGELQIETTINDHFDLIEDELHLSLNRYITNEY